jgi:lysozyme
MSKQDLIRQIIRHEGFKKFPYRCTAGKLTIGVGRNIDDVGISESEALFLLENDIDRVTAELRSRDYFQAVEGDDVRSRVLIDMAFNLGIAGLDKFRRTLDAVKRKDFVEASDLMLESRWATQVGQRARRLAEMMKTGREA